MDNPVPPDQEDVQDLLDQGHELLEKLIHRSEASRIDNKFINSKDNHPLDDIQYGEELTITESLPSQVQEAIDPLNKISEEELSPETVAKYFENAEESIQNAQDTLDDCTEIPHSNDEDEE